MRFIDEIINAVNKHPFMSAIHKRVLITRIERAPSSEELREAERYLNEQKRREVT